MATTSPDNLWSPDAADDYSLTVDWAASMDTVQDAFNARQPVPGVVTMGQYWKNHPDWQPLELTRTGNIVNLSGVATLNQTVTLSANIAYTLCTVPVGFRPPTGRKVFDAASFSPFTTGYGWVSVSPGGAVEFAVSNSTSQDANVWLIGVNLRWTVA